jgi:hypothetical protein
MLNKGLIFTLLFCLSMGKVFSQGQDKTILFQVQIVAKNGSEFLPMAYVYNPKAGRGALSDNFGRADLLVFPGDSLVFTYIGYKKQYYIIPKSVEQVNKKSFPWMKILRCWPK